MSAEVPEHIQDIIEKFPDSYLVIPLRERVKEAELPKTVSFVHVPFKGSEIYLLQKSFIDAGGAPGETYKSIFEKTGAHLTIKIRKVSASRACKNVVIKLTMNQKKMLNDFYKR